MPIILLRHLNIGALRDRVFNAFQARTPVEVSARDLARAAIMATRHRRGLRLLVLMIALASAGVRPASAHAESAAPTLATYVLQNRSTQFELNVPVTFGAVFAPGEVPAGYEVGAIGEDGSAIPTQTDAKARNGDGSLRHAVLTLDVPHLSTGRDTPVRLVLAKANRREPMGLSALPDGFRADVELTLGDKTLHASVGDLLSQAKPSAWLSGPLVTEWWVSGPFRDQTGKADPHLSVQFGVRSYGIGRPLRIEVDVENDWTWVPHPKAEFYDAVIRINDAVRFRKAGMAQMAQTRWREVFWWRQPVDVFVKPDLTSLERARVVPNYDPAAPNLESEVSALYRHFQASDRGPLGNGIITAYMPTTGGRPDIGPLPAWTVLYLLTMDPRAAAITMSSADLSGSFPAHYRNIRTGRPTTTEEYPNISTHSNLVGKPGNLERPDNGTFKPVLHPDSSHQPSLAFIPYVITGERYYLEELQFWSQFSSWGTAPGYHGGAKSLFNWDEVRGQAWTLRTLAQAAYITPDSDPMKGTLLRELKANADWYNATYAMNPNANIFHAVHWPHEISPWMDDFVTWAAHYAVDLGFDEWKPFALWKALFPVQRMINPHYCWILATPYRMRIDKEDGHPITSWADAYTVNLTLQAKKKTELAGVECGSQQMAYALGLKTAGEMLGNAGSGGGYTANLQPALAAAVDLGITGAKEAWAQFQARAVKPKAGIDPWWNIVPRSAR